MSVFTPVSDADARALLRHYALGSFEKLEGIAQGVENTNYFLTTTTGEYVLTLFEQLARADLPFYVGLMDHLARRGVRCPVPMHREHGDMLSELNGKPACIVTRLPGAPHVNPGVHDCHAAGALLGDLHAAGVDYDAGLANARGREWREAFAREISPLLSGGENDLIAAENAYQAKHDDTALPQGVIHGDFFHDNVLWDEERQGGVIDFYFACDDVLLFDVAIAVNDWCTTPEAALDRDREHAFLAGYASRRALEENERASWNAMLRRAALRTWLGRLGYNHFPRAASMTIAKDHEFSRRLLEHHVRHPRGPA